MYLQKYLADTIQQPFFSPSIFTIQEFFSEAVDEKPADFYMQFFTLLTIYNQLLAEEGLPALKSSQFFALAKIILNDFSQVDNDLVDADKLYKELEEISTINIEFDYLTPEQYAFLSQFWQSYSEGKHKRQQELFIQMWRRMPKLYHRFHAALAEKHHITNGGAYRKLAAMEITALDFLKKFEKGKIIFVGFNALSRAEAQLFTKLQEAGKALFYFDTDEYYLKDSLQEAGYFLRRNTRELHLKNEFSVPFEGINKASHTVDVYKVQGQAAQAKILNQILENDYNEDREVDAVAVVLADEALLLPALQTIPSTSNNKAVNLNVTMGFPLGITTVFGLADLWLSCQLEMLRNKGLGKSTTHISYQHLESFLTHPLTGVSQQMKDKIRTALLAENIVLIDQGRMVRQGGILKKFFTEVEKPAELITALLDVLQYVLNNLSQKKILKKIDAELFVQTIHELNRLNDNIKDYLEQEELPFVISLAQKALQSISVPLSGDPLQGIQLMGLLETRNLNFNKLVFLGFNEGIIPKTSIGNSFIPDSLRRVHGLPVLENLDAISSYMVYRLLQRAEAISIVYNSLTDESTSGEPSRLLKQLEYETAFAFHYHELELPVQTQEKDVIEIDKKHPAIKERLQRFLNKEKTLSPSAITLYIANPIDFFFSYVANIKEPKEVTAIVEANEIGSILHKAMHDFYTPVLRKEVTKDWIQQRRKNKEELVERAFCAVRAMPGADTYEFSGMQQVVLAIVEAYVDIITDQDEADAPFTIVGLEEKINAEIPFELKGKKQSIKIFGIVDRIDVKAGVTRIVDYKTGKDSLTIKEDIEKVFDTNDKHINKALIQTMIYADAYEKKSGRKNVQPVLYVVKSMKEEGILFKAGKNELKESLLAEVKPAFLAGLECKLAELFDEDIPFRASELADNYQYSLYTRLF